MNRKIAFPVAAAAAFAAFVAVPGANAQVTLPSMISKCETCHGPRGDSVSPDVPRLNGQLAQYLVPRFKSFRDITRQTPHATKNMWPIVQQVPGDMIPGIADYFSRQAPTPMTGSGPLANEGKEIFQRGAPGVAACQTCHGAQAEGKGAIPRLAGQHGVYLAAQLSAIHLQMRVNDAMHPLVRSMTQHQMDAVVAYLANG